MNLAKFSPGNLFDSIPDRLDEEIFESLFKHSGISIQRILSRGQTTDWSVQDTDEWVLLVRGSATIVFDGEERLVSLRAGDYFSIPAGCRHRISWTDPAETSVWLAVHF